MYIFQCLSYKCNLCDKWMYGSGARLDNRRRVCLDCLQTDPFICKTCGKFLPAIFRSDDYPEKNICTQCAEKVCDEEQKKAADMFAKRYSGKPISFLIDLLDTKDDVLIAEEWMNVESRLPEIPWTMDEAGSNAQPASSHSRSNNHQYEGDRDYRLITGFDPSISSRDGDSSDLRDKLNPESFLHEMGYNTKVSDSMRHYILQRAVRLYGWNPVIRHLQFLLRLHANNWNMDSVYHIWEEDYEYVKNLSE